MTNLNYADTILGNLPIVANDQNYQNDSICLLLAPKGRVGALIRDRALIWDWALISFLRNKRILKTKL